MPDPYQVLGIQPGATRDEITRGYRQALMHAHPDHGGTRAQFDLVQGAHAWLMASLDANPAPPAPAPAPHPRPNPPRPAPTGPASWPDAQPSHTDHQDAPGSDAAGQWDPEVEQPGGLRRGAGAPRRGMPVQERRRWWQD